MDTRIRLGISTCPNDTFAFHAILTEQVDLRGLKLDIQLLDIQQLNDRLFRRELEVAKASFHAALWMAEDYWVLPSGSALGFGVGPLLLAASADCYPSSPTQVTLCPGEHTTATLLFRLFYPNTSQVKQVLFSDIMPQLQKKGADFGVCIHEGRFTWESSGLHCLEDLGTRWEKETQLPLPLGGIVASKNLSHSTLETFQAVLYDSIQYGLQHPERTLDTMRQYAQEFDNQVLMQHVQLYVNQWTINLGELGQQALQELSKRAQSQIGLQQPLQVLPWDPCP